MPVRCFACTCLILALLAGSPAGADRLELTQVSEGDAAAPLLQEDGVLGFRLLLSAACADGEELSAVSVALADTRVAADLQTLDAEGSVELELEVPSRQLQGVNKRLLCKDETAPEGSLRLLHGAFSANTSARCLHPDKGSRTLYATTDIDVSLWCPGSGADQSDAPAAGAR